MSDIARGYDEWTQRMLGPSTRDCIHGRLARSCPECEQEKEIHDLRQQLEGAVDALETLVDACGHWIAAKQPPNETTVEQWRQYVATLRRGQ